MTSPLGLFSMTIALVCANVAAGEGDPSDATMRAWYVGRQLFLDAGGLDNIGPGAQVTLSPRNGGREFNARVLHADPEVSELAPLSGEGVGLAEGPFAVRAIDPKPPFILKVGVDLKAGGPEAVRRLKQVVEQFAAGSSATRWPVTFERDLGSVDVILTLVGDHLVVTREGDRGVPEDHPAALIVDAELTSRRLAEALRVVARAENLLRMARAPKLLTLGANLQTEVWVASGKTRDGCTDLIFDPNQPPLGVTPFDLKTGLPLPIADCDLVYIRVTNRSDGPLVVTPLYIARDFAILDPDPDALDRYLLPGEAAMLVFGIDQKGQANGSESLVLLEEAIRGLHEYWTATLDGAQPADLSHLCQPGLMSLQGVVVTDEPVLALGAPAHRDALPPSAGQFDDMGAVVIPLIPRYDATSDR